MTCAESIRAGSRGSGWAPQSRRPRVGTGKYDAPVADGKNIGAGPAHPFLSRRSALLSVPLTGLGLIALGACSSSTDHDTSPTRSAAPSGPDDTEELRAAVSRSRAAGAPVVLDVGRTYRVSGGIDVSGVVVRGSKATLQWLGQMQVATPGVLYSTGDLHVSDLLVDFPAGGRSGATAPAGLQCLAAEGAAVTVSRVTVRNAPGAGVRIQSAGGISTASDAPEVPTAITAVTTTGCRYGIQVTGIRDVAVRGSTADESQVNGIHVELCADIDLRRNSASSNGGHGIVTLYSPHCVVDHNVASHNGRGGITIGGGDPGRETTHNVVVRSNVTEFNRLNGISLDITIRGQSGVPIPIDATVAGNRSNDNDKHGINVTCSSNVLVEDNICRRNRSGIALATSEVEVRGNVCESNRRYGIALFDKGSATSYDGHVIGQNVLDRNGAGNYFVAPSLKGEVQYS